MHNSVVCMWLKGLMAPCTDGLITHHDGHACMLTTAGAYAVFLGLECGIISPLDSVPCGVMCPVGQHVLERTAVLVSGAGGVEARFTVGLPAQGRSIMGRWAAQIITQHITG